METQYLASVKKQLKYYKVLGDKTFEQLSDNELFHQIHPESNTIAMLINHLSENMKSRWTEFLSSDGEKEWRN